MSDPLRTRTASSESDDTYTRSSMESGAVVNRDMPLTDPSETDPPMAMALLAAHEQERSRLAEELHDGPAQVLANAIFQIEIVDRAVREDATAARAELAALRQMLERELDALRGYINQLRPSLGEAAGLEEALRESANAVSQRNGLPIEIGSTRPATSCTLQPGWSRCASHRRRCATSPSTPGQRGHG